MDSSRITLAGLGIFLFTCSIIAHEETPFTHEFGPISEIRDEGALQVSVLDANTGETLNARLSFEINSDYWAPEEVNKNGILFASIHKSKQQRFTVIYALDPGADNDCLSRRG